MNRIEVKCYNFVICSATEWISVGMRVLGSGAIKLPLMVSVCYRIWRRDRKGVLCPCYACPLRDTKVSGISTMSPGRETFGYTLLAQ